MQTDKLIVIAIIAVIVFFSTLVPNFAGLVISLIFLFGFFSLFKKGNVESTYVYRKPYVVSDTQEFLAMKREYLESNVWKEKRRKRKEIDNYTCQACGAKYGLQVHHISGYKDIPLESTACLVTVCYPCHKLQHDTHGFPKTMKDYENWYAPLVKR